MDQFKNIFRQAHSLLKSLEIPPLFLTAGILVCIFFPRFFLLAAAGYAVFWMVRNIWSDPLRRGKPLDIKNADAASNHNEDIHDSQATTAVAHSRNHHSLGLVRPLFLTVLSLLFLANHYWDIILAMVQTVHSLVLKGAELLRAL